jgi:phage tail-like protein
MSFERPLLQTGRFVVEMDNILVAYFQECSGLSFEVETQEIVEGGNNEFVRKIPGKAKYSNITLKRGLTDSSQFLDWRPTFSNGKITIQRKMLSIKIFTHGGETIKQWDVTGAFPIKWTGPDLKATGMEVAIESLELVHEGWKEVK